MATLEFLSDIDTSMQIECHNILNAEECSSVISKYFIKILHVNIRSMQCNFDNFLLIFARMGIPFDVVIMTECWINPSSTIKQLDGYQSYNTTTYINKSGGVIAYVNNKWSPNVIEPALDEANGLIVEVPNVFTVIGIYRSPSFPDTATFISSLDRNLKALATNQCLTVVGDLNINILSPSLNEESTSTYLNLLSEYDLVSAINVPTHNKTCLDHIFVSAKATAEAVVCPADLTDHCMVMVGIASKSRKVIQRTRLKIDYEGLVSELDKTDWNSVIENECLENDVNMFCKVLSDTAARFSQEVKVSHSKFNIKPWMTPGLIRCSRHRDKLHSESRKFPHDEHKKLVYSRYRNFYVSLLRRLKSEYESKELNDNKNCPKKLWKSINRISHRTPLNSNDRAQELLSPKNGSKFEALKASNTYFTSVGKNLARSILSSLSETQESLAAKTSLNNPPLNSFFISPTDEQEIISLINKLDPNSSPGIDQINNKILKAVKSSIATPLVSIFNRSITSGYFPKTWKTAVVVPIYKGGAKNDPGNYRPISLLGSISKLLERIVNERLMKYLEQNNYLSDSQFGFRRGKSTEDAVNLLTNVVSTHLDNGSSCIGVFLDLAKAFDTVSVPILLRKLEGFGIRGTALDWFTSYLTERNQCIRIGHLVSEVQPVSFGVPQGSILGPTLFILYMNDICSVPVKNADIICYADDTALIFHDTSWEQVRLRTEDGMNLISQWLSKNLLTLNTAKTKFLCFHKTIASSPPVILDQMKIHSCQGGNRRLCDCSLIKKADFLRYLGVMIDDKLSFKEHITLMSSRVRKIIHVMKNLREAANGRILKTVYLALCQSIINYCILAWGGCAKSTLIPLERAQRGVLKVALFKPILYPTAALFNEAEVLSVRRLFLVRAAVYTHTKVINSNTYSDLVKKRVYKIPAPFTRTTFSHRFGYFLFPRIYNKLAGLYNFKSLSVPQTKRLLTKMLLKWNYNETEDLLKPIL